MSSARIIFIALVAVTACTYPPLMRAAAEGDTSRVSSLIQQGENVNQADRGFTPLLAATQLGRIETARLLIEKGADVHARDPAGHTALEFAAHGGHLELCKMLVDRGAQLDAADEVGATPLEVASVMNRADVAAYLLDHGAP